MVVSVAFLVDLLCGFFLGRAGNSTLSVVSMLGGHPRVPDVSRSLPGEAGRVCLPRPVSTFDTVSVLCSCCSGVI